MVAPPPFSLAGSLPLSLRYSSAGIAAPLQTANPAVAPTGAGVHRHPIPPSRITTPAQKPGSSRDLSLGPSATASATGDSRARQWRHSLSASGRSFAVTAGLPWPRCRPLKPGSRGSTDPIGGWLCGPGDQVSGLPGRRMADPGNPLEIIRSAASLSSLVGAQALRPPRSARSFAWSRQPFATINHASSRRCGRQRRSRVTTLHGQLSAPSQWRQIQGKGSMASPSPSLPFQRLGWG
jgi:hypothetical protein